MAQDEKPLTDNELQGALERAFLMQGREESTIEWVREALCMYRQVLEELQAARGALKVTWIPCEDRMPAAEKFVWVSIPGTLLGMAKTLYGTWEFLFVLAAFRIPPTHWLEIRWPEPPEKGE